VLFENRAQKQLRNATPRVGLRFGSGSVPPSNQQESTTELLELESLINLNSS